MQNAHKDSTAKAGRIRVHQDIGDALVNKLRLQQQGKTPLKLKQLGETIEASRRELFMSRDELGKSTGIFPHHIMLLERGLLSHELITKSMLEALVKVLKLDFESAVAAFNAEPDAQLEYIPPQCDERGQMFNLRIYQEIDPATRLEMIRAWLLDEFDGRVPEQQQLSTVLTEKTVAEEQMSIYDSPKYISDMNLHDTNLGQIDCGHYYGRSPVHEQLHYKRLSAGAKSP